MTKVDFYVLADMARDNRYQLACRLVNKIYHQGRRIYIHTNSEEDARHMDRLLWTFRQGSFVPHGRLPASDPEITPVLIGCDGNVGDEKDVLVNLAAETPSFFSRFDRVAEFIDSDPAVKKTGRERFLFYRDRGYPLETHNI